MLMRAASGQRPDAVSPAWRRCARRTRVRLLRPLLAISPGAASRDAPSGWRRLGRGPDQRRPARAPRPTAAPCSRTGLRVRRAAYSPKRRGHGAARADSERETAAFLARSAAIHAGGLRGARAGTRAREALSSADPRRRWADATRRASASVARLAAEPRPSTISGVRLSPAGRAGPGCCSHARRRPSRSAVPGPRRARSGTAVSGWRKTPSRRPGP